MVANPVAIRFVLAEHIHHNAELLDARFKAKNRVERILMAPVEVNLISEIEVGGNPTTSHAIEPRDIRIFMRMS
jgi:hypothetical protein